MDRSANRHASAWAADSGNDALRCTYWRHSACVRRADEDRAFFREPQKTSREQLVTSEWRAITVPHRMRAPGQPHLILIRYSAPNADLLQNCKVVHEVWQPLASVFYTRVIDALLSLCYSLTLRLALSSGNLKLPLLGTFPA